MTRYADSLAKTVSRIVGSTTAAGTVASFLLIGIFFLELKFPVILAVATAFLVFAARLFETRKTDAIGILVLANFGYWIWSTVLVGSLSPMDVPTPAFLSGDGRVFLSYIPLLFFAVVDVTEADFERFIRLVRSLGLLSIGLFMFWVPTHAGFLSEGAAGHFVGFLTSHTGGGTFFGILSVFLLVFGHESGRKREAIVGWLMVFPLLGTGSREALLAFLAVMGWYLIKKREWKTIGAATFLLAFFLAVMPILAPKTWSRTSGLFTLDLIDSIVETAEQSDWKPGDGEDALDLQGTQVNVLFRVTIWTYAMKRFFDSPFLGIGFGRYNDYDLRLSGLPGFVYVATDGYKIIGASNAHNSYVHFLCEVGILGLTLVLLLWFFLYRRMREGERTFAVLKDIRAASFAGQGIVLFVLVAALTGHAMAAPSTGIPATTILGVLLAYQNGLRKSVKLGAA